MNIEYEFIADILRLQITDKEDRVDWIDIPKHEFLAWLFGGSAK